MTTTASAKLHFYAVREPASLQGVHLGWAELQSVQKQLREYRKFDCLLQAKAYLATYLGTPQVEGKVAVELLLCADGETKHSMECFAQLPAAVCRGKRISAPPAERGAHPLARRLATLMRAISEITKACAPALFVGEVHVRTTCGETAEALQNGLVALDKQLVQQIAAHREAADIGLLKLVGLMRRQTKSMRLTASVALATEKPLPLLLSGGAGGSSTGSSSTGSSSAGSGTA